MQLAEHLAEMVPVREAKVFFHQRRAVTDARLSTVRLGEGPDYPARLDLPYPERLSRGLVLPTGGQVRRRVAADPP